MTQPPEDVARILRTSLPTNVVRMNKRVVNLVYEQMGLIDAVRYRDNDALPEFLEAEDTVGTGRQRIREEQGWAAFKRERDQGEESE